MKLIFIVVSGEAASHFVISTISVGILVCSTRFSDFAGIFLVSDGQFVCRVPLLITLQSDVQNNRM